jgi:hypothetical protein
MDIFLSNKNCYRKYRGLLYTPRRNPGHTAAVAASAASASVVCVIFIVLDIYYIPTIHE